MKFGFSASQGAVMALAVTLQEFKLNISDTFEGDCGWALARWPAMPMDDL
jgi:hypothetical protein